MTISLGLEELGPAVGLVFLLELDGVVNLTELDLDELGVFVTAGVAFGEDVEGFLGFAFSDEVTG